MLHLEFQYNLELVLDSDDIMVIRIPRGSRTDSRNIGRSSLLQVARANRVPVESIGNAVNNLGQAILDAENEKQKIRTQNKLYSAEAQILREMNQRANEIYLDQNNSFEPNNVQQYIQDNVEYVDKRLSELFKGDEEGLKYTGRIRFNALQQYEKDIYRFSNQRLATDTIAAYPSQLQSYKEQIMNIPVGSTGEGIFTAINNTFIPELEQLAKNSRRFGGNVNIEQDKRMLKLMAFQKILQKGSAKIDEITNEKTFDYTNIINILNSPDTKKLGGENISEDDKRDLKKIYVDERKKHRANVAIFTEVENNKKFIEAERIRDIPEISQAEQRDRISKLKFVGKKGEEIKQSILKTVDSEIERGVITPTTQSQRIRIDDLIIANKVTSLYEKQVVDDDIVTDLKKRKIIPETDSAVSLFDMQRGGLLRKEDVKVNGYFDKKIKRIADPLKKQQDTAFKEFVDRIKPSIIGSTQNKLAESSPRAVRRFSEAYLKLSERFEEGLAAGKTAKQLLSAGTADYIYVEEPLLTDKGGFRPTQQDITIETSEAFGVKVRSKEDKELTEKQLITKEINQLQEIIKRITELDNLTIDQQRALPQYQRIRELFDQRESQ